MKIRLVAVLALILAFGALAQASPPGDLEEAFDSFLNAISNKDLKAFTEAWHPEAVVFTRNQPFPMDLKELTQDGWSELFKDVFARLDMISYKAVNVNAREIGDTGIVWGSTYLVLKGSDGTSRSDTGTLTAVFLKSGGKWKLISWHDSHLPPQDK